MATIKSYSDLEQSKKLAEILPLESADMGWYYSRNPQAARNQMWAGTKAKNADIPCWSLAALLSVLPKEIVYDKHIIVFLEFHVWENSFEYVNNVDYSLYVTESYDNPVDACVDMIEKLHRLNLL